MPDVGFGGTQYPFGTALTWNVWAGEVRTGYTGEFKDWVLTTAWSPGGGQIAVGEHDGQIKLLDSNTMQVMTILDIGGSAAQQYSDVIRIYWSADGRWLIAAYRDEHVRVWDVRTATILSSWQTVNLRDISFAVHGNVVAEIVPNQINIRQLPDGAIARTITGNDYASISLSPDGERIAFNEYSGEVVVHEASSNQFIYRSATMPFFITTLSWSPDGKWIGIGGPDGVFAVVEALTGARVQLFQKGLGSIDRIAWTLDSRYVATCDTFDSLTIWNTADFEPVQTLEYRLGYTAAAWRPSTMQLAVASNNGKIAVWDAKTVGRILQLREFSEPAENLAWSPDGTLLVGSTLTKGVVWDISRDAVTHTIQGSQLYFKDIEWAPNNSYLAILSRQRIELWDPISQRIQGSIVTGFKACCTWGLAFSPRSDAVALSASILTDNGTQSGIVIFEVASRKKRVSWLTEGSVERVIWAPDETLIAGTYKNADNSQTVAVWDVTTGEMLSSWVHLETITALSWYPAGMTIAVGDIDGNIVLWNPKL